LTRQIHIWPRPVEKRNGSLIISASIAGARGAGKTFWFQMDESYESWLTDSADPWVLTAILNAMRSGTDLVVHGAVSHSLLVNLERFQQVWSQWRPNQYHPVDITVEGEWPDQSRPGEAVMGFTGGVDSCFTAYRLRRGLHGGMAPNVTAGLMVLGFDVPLSDRAQFGPVLGKCERLLRDIGMESLSMVTNIRRQPVKWVDLHGTALAAGLTLLAGRFTAGVIASTLAPRYQHDAWGSHPVTDPLMGSEGFPIVNDGTEYGREDKVRPLAEWRQAMVDLRVCWEGSQRDRNCGRCFKCIQTKLCFMVNDLPVPPALGEPPTESEIRSWNLTEEWQLSYIEVFTERARQCHQDGQPWFDVLLELHRSHRNLRRRFLWNRVRRVLGVYALQAILAWLRGDRVDRAGLPCWTGEMQQTPKEGKGSF
jgi:hypothetical protein